MPRRRIASWRMIAKAGAGAFNQSTFTSSWRVSCARGFKRRMEEVIGGEHPFRGVRSDLSRR
jgi:predicted DNA-binding ribbon-helix-helix protein